MLTRCPVFASCSATQKVMYGSSRAPTPKKSALAHDSVATMTTGYRCGGATASIVATSVSSMRPATYQWVGALTLLVPRSPSRLWRAAARARRVRHPRAGRSVRELVARPVLYDQHALGAIAQSV